MFQKLTWYWKLSEKILKKNPKSLYVIEKDQNLVNILKKKFSDKINIINEDILKYDLDIQKKCSSFWKPSIQYFQSNFD